MTPYNAIVILAFAVALDWAIGDPVYSWHPIRLVGKVITMLEKCLRRQGADGLVGGILLLLTSCAVSASTYLMISHLLARTHHGLLHAFNLFVLYSLLAIGDLRHHAGRVAAALARNDLVPARNAVAMMVGRKTANLDTGAICRATIESVAENFVDGFAAPVFWYAVGAAITQSASLGVLLALIFKTVSTLDSMVGYKTQNYLFFGRASAKADDVLNFIPARLSIIFIATAALTLRLGWRNCGKVARRDRLKHASPNSAHGEAAVAGALGVRLGGPTEYDSGIQEKPWLGEDGREAATADINRAVRLVMATALVVTIAAACAIYLCRIHLRQFFPELDLTSQHPWLDCLDWMLAPGTPCKPEAVAPL